jgi:hypothetical protein
MWNERGAGAGWKLRAGGEKWPVSGLLCWPNAFPGPLEGEAYFEPPNPPLFEAYWEFLKPPLCA